MSKFFVDLNLPPFTSDQMENAKDRKQASSGMGRATSKKNAQGRKVLIHTQST